MATLLKVIVTKAGSMVVHVHQTPANVLALCSVTGWASMLVTPELASRLRRPRDLAVSAGNQVRVNR